MNDSGAFLPDTGVRTEISDALVAIWTRYAGRRPTSARTELHDNVVTCVLVDAVGVYESALPASRLPVGAAAEKPLLPAVYRREAVALVERLTGGRVTRFISSHDPDTDVATETFRLARKLFA